MRTFEANSPLFNENLRNVWPAYTAFAADPLFSDSLLGKRGDGERAGPKRRQLHLRNPSVGDSRANEKRREAPALSAIRRSHVLVPPSQGLEILGQNGLFPFFAQPLGEHFLDGIELESPGSLEVDPKLF